MVSAVVLVWSAAGCGGGPTCGNGKPDQGEECDDGNNDDTDFCLSTCMLRPTRDLTVLWGFNADDAAGFSGDSCLDMGARSVSVSLEGPTTAETSEQCSFRQVMFRDLAAGSYTVEATPLDGADQELASATSVPIEIGDFGDYDLEINVPLEAWLSPYTGNFFFRVEWGGVDLDCATAAVPVVMQELTFSRDGSPVAVATKAGDPLDGTQSLCRSLGDNEPQTILDIPFGPATLRIVGYDSVGDARYDQTFDTFVGAGVNNPEFRFQVAPLP